MTRQQAAILKALEGSTSEKPIHAQDLAKLIGCHSQDPRGVLKVQIFHLRSQGIMIESNYQAPRRFRRDGWGAYWLKEESNGTTKQDTGSKTVG